jgi:hypothetical protein
LRSAPWGFVAEVGAVLHPEKEVAMQKFQVFSPDTEVRGQTMLAFIQYINHEEIKPFLQSHDLDHIVPDQWYPLQQFLDVLNDISQYPGALFDFVSIGMKIIEVVEVPPDFAKLPYEQVALQHNTIYQRQHRGTDPGEYRVERVGDNHLKVTARVPYPDDFVYGAIYGEARRFLPKGTHVTVAYDKSCARRAQGGSETILHVTWN